MYGLTSSLTVLSINKKEVSPDSERFAIFTKRKSIDFFKNYFKLKEVPFGTDVVPFINRICDSENITIGPKALDKVDRKETEVIYFIEYVPSLDISKGKSLKESKADKENRYFIIRGGIYLRALDDLLLTRTSIPISALDIDLLSPNNPKRSLIHSLLPNYILSLHIDKLPDTVLFEKPREWIVGRYFVLKTATESSDINGLFKKYLYDGITEPVKLRELNEYSYILMASLGFTYITGRNEADSSRIKKWFIEKETLVYRLLFRSLKSEVDIINAIHNSGVYKSGAEILIVPTNPQNIFHASILKNFEIVHKSLSPSPKFLISIPIKRIYEIMKNVNWSEFTIIDSDAYFTYKSVENLLAAIYSTLLEKKIYSDYSIQRCRDLVNENLNHIDDSFLPSVHAAIIMHEEILGVKVETKAKRKREGDSFIVPDIEECHKNKTLPFCQSILLHKLKTKEHIKHGARVQFARFARDIDIGLEKLRSITKVEGAKDEKKAKEAAKDIENAYLAKEKDKGYRYRTHPCNSTASWIKIPGDPHGCPFVYLKEDMNAMVGYLKEIYGLSDKQVLSITKNIRDNISPTLPCHELYKLFHKDVPESLIERPHPMDYLEYALKSASLKVNKTL
jgi:DNA primase large subunit